MNKQASKQTTGASHSTFEMNWVGHQVEGEHTADVLLVLFYFVFLGAGVVYLKKNN